MARVYDGERTALALTLAAEHSVLREEIARAAEPVLRPGERPAQPRRCPGGSGPG